MPILINNPLHLFNMKALLLSILLLLSLSHALEYSTLEIEALDQKGDPVQGVNFFITCRMTFTTVDRFLCKTGVNGTCMSGCVECAPGWPAFVHAQYGNQSVEQEIPSWRGSDAESCKPYYPTSNPLGTFLFWVESPPEAETPEYADGAGENLPENVNIENKEYRIGFEEEEYEYVSYVDYGEDKEEEGCLPAFALLAILLTCAGARAPG
jgi:hypothetical protein